MIVFEHRRFDNELAKHRNGWGVTKEIVATFYGEEKRTLAYGTCPPDCVVWERYE